MPLARIVTRYPDEAIELAMQLRARGFQVETVSPEQISESEPDLEIQLDSCDAQDVLEHVMGLSVDGASVLVAPGSLNNGGFSAMPALRYPIPSRATLSGSPTAPHESTIIANEPSVISEPGNGSGDPIRWRIVEDSVHQEAFAFEGESKTQALSDPVAKSEPRLTQEPSRALAREVAEESSEKLISVPPRIELHVPQPESEALKEGAEEAESVIREPKARGLKADDLEIADLDEAKVIAQPNVSEPLPHESAAATPIVAVDASPSSASGYPLESVPASGSAREEATHAGRATEQIKPEPLPKNATPDETPAEESPEDSGARQVRSKMQVPAENGGDEAPAARIIPLRVSGEPRPIRRILLPIISKQKTDPIFWKIAIAAAGLAACVVILGSIWQQGHPAAGRLPSPNAQKMPFQRPATDTPATSSPQPPAAAATQNPAPSPAAKPQSSVSLPSLVADTPAPSRTPKPAPAKSTASKKQTSKKSNRVAQHHSSQSDSGFIAKDTITYFDRKPSQSSPATNSSSK